jgi:hypothetical protein
MRLLISMTLDSTFFFLVCFLMELTTGHTNFKSHRLMREFER